MFTLGLSELIQVSGGGQAGVEEEGNNIVNYGDGYIYGNISIPPSEYNQILKLSIVVKDDTVFNTLNVLS